jgi:hypothetical protein
VVLENAVSIVEMPWSLSSFDQSILQRQMSPLDAPFGGCVFAQMPSMFNSYNAGQNCVCPAPPVAEA